MVQLWPIVHKALGSISNTTKSKGNKHIGYYIRSCHKSYFRVCCGGRARGQLLGVDSLVTLWHLRENSGHRSCVQALPLTKPS